MMKFMPSEFQLLETRQPPLKDQYDEWLARIICFAVSVPASAFVSHVNRATSETLRMQATQEGLQPLKAWVKSALDHVIRVYLSEPDLEFVWVGDDAIDPLEQAKTLSILVAAGIKTRDEARAELGLAPAASEGAPELKRTDGTGFEKWNFNPLQPRDESGRWSVGTQEVDGSRSTEVVYQGKFHDVLVGNQIEQYRKGGAKCVSEVRLQFGGVTARLDILCVSQLGTMTGVEVKTGDDPDFTIQQKLVYPHAELGSGVTSPDSKIKDLGWVADAPLPPFPIYLLLSPGPGLPFKFFGPKPKDN
jgi:hypothetical protein